VVAKTISLTDAEAAAIDRLTASGQYRDTNEVMSAALDLLLRSEAVVDDVRSRLAASLGEADRGALAEGHGADAVYRTFARARSGR
jgi:Arc/MetJ-type ribon-helix-helix transcriptional regulator